MPRRRPGRLFWIIPLIDIAVLAQPVLFAPKLHELPHAGSVGAGTRLGTESRFGLREVENLRWNTLFLENTGDHRLISAGPLEGPNQRFLAPSSEIVDVLDDLGIQHEGKFGLGGAQPLHPHRFEVEIIGDRGVVQFVDQCPLVFGFGLGKTIMGRRRHLNQGLEGSLFEALKKLSFLCRGLCWVWGC